MIRSLGRSVRTGEDHSKHQGAHKDQEHETRANSHTFNVVRLVAVGIESRSEQGTELAEDVEHDHAGPFLRVRVLVVDRPRDDDGDGGEEACGARIHAGIPPPCARSFPARDGDDQVARAAHQGAETHEQASAPVSIRQVCDQKHDDEGEKVRRGGKGLGCQGGITHSVEKSVGRILITFRTPAYLLVDDCGQEWR